jgi:hypothetical protein
MMKTRMITAEKAGHFEEEQWQAWDGMLQKEPSIHLSSRAIRAVLRSPNRLVCAAIWLNEKDDLVGIAVCEDSVAMSQGVDQHLEGTGAFQRVKRWMHRKGGLQFKVRVVGTPLASGPHGHRFLPGVDAHKCLEELCQSPGVLTALNHKAPNAWLVKDQYANALWGDGQRLAGASSWNPHWTDLEFDPVMKVSLVGLTSFEQYKTALRTKARTKVKRIESLSHALTFENFSAQDIQDNLPELYRLYQAVYDRMAFRLGSLMPEDLVLLKEELKDDFQLWAAYLDGACIGFHCGMTNGHEVEAFFVGFDGPYNKTHALYQRMLLEFIRWGIERGCASVNLGRTALDVKSSLGAEPHRLVLHQRMAVTWLHWFVAWAAKASAPKQPPLKRSWKTELATKPSVHHEVLST